MKREKVEDVLLSIGITPNLRGFKYISDALCIMDQNKPQGFKMTCVYSDVAKMNEENPSNIERNIRTALASARKRNRNPKLLEHYIGMDKRTNSASLYRMFLMLRREASNE